MRPTPETSTDNQALRRYLRDLLSLTALSSAEAEADRHQIAQGLADAVVEALSPEVVHVRLASPGGAEAIEVSCFDDGEIHRALKPLLPDGIDETTVLSLALGAAGRPVTAAVVPVGSRGELGILMAASGQPGFPSEEDRLFLEVAANQAAVVLQLQSAGESGALLAAIVESSEDAIVSKTLEGIITSWNVGAERLFGYSSAEAVGQPVTLIIPAERRHEETMILERLRRGERIEHFETVRQSKQGRLIDISLAISPVRDRTGRIIGASKIARDITYSKQVEEALKDADRRKDEFLAMLAHELRNPLAPIRNAIEILRTKSPPEPELDWARNVIERQVQQMTRLVDDLLDVSRITQGKIALRRERIQLAEVVGNAVEASRSLVEELGHQLTVTLPSEPILLEVDPARLFQVLMNLLNNAAKYTNPGGRIWLTAEPGGEVVSIRVRDNGIGIAPEMLPRVFEIFTQAEHSMDRSQGGLGIGLTLVQRLVEMHGGTVSAHSEGTGKGTEILIRLPALGYEPDRQPESAIQDKTAADPSRLLILVVDDNRDAAESLAMLLQMWGHEVRMAHDGLAAVEAAAAFQPDVVLLDIGLPKLNGYDAARQISQARRSSMVLVALTGWGQDEDRRRSSEAGFDHHLTKPVELEALQKVLAGIGTGS